MDNFVILSPEAVSQRERCRISAVATLEGTPVHCGLLSTPTPRFEASASHHRHDALLRVRSFSLNYRDRGGVFINALRETDGRVRKIGSDYVAEVVAVGSEVRDLTPGMRVIPEGSFAQRRCEIREDVTTGLQSDRISSQWLVADARKLVAIPDAMSDEVAASFTIGGMTSFSMVRRLDPQPGERIVVLGGRSVTSLCLVEALRERDVEIICVSRSRAGKAALEHRGVHEVLALDESPGTSWSEHPRLAKLAGDVDCIFDPFADLHLRNSLKLLAIGGRYITCGFVHQYQTLFGDAHRPDGADIGDALSDLVFRNLTIVGNCMGSRADLQAAVDAHARGSFDLPIDSVFRGEQLAPFLERSFAAPDRFGKVPYVFE